MRRIVKAVSLLAFLAGAAAAADTRVNWLRMPSQAEFRNIWPTAGSRINRAKVVIRCLVGGDGLLKGCEVKSEDPAGKGFGAAAVRMAGEYRLKPGDHAGEILEVPVDFHNLAPARTTEARLIDPYWGRAPSWAEMLAAFPQKAKSAEGMAVIRCWVDMEGGLEDCSVLTESPRGQGFGQAALGLARGFGLASPPDPADGKRYEATLPLRFSKQPEDGRVLKSPQWMRSVGLEEARVLYPEKARLAGVAAGEATLRCRATDRGQVRDCAVLSETPAGLGFGEAALRLSARLVMNPWSNGVPAAGASVSFPVKFAGP